MKVLALLIVLFLTSCSAVRIPAEEPEEWDTVYQGQGRHSGVWVQVNDSTWVKDTIP